ncbi:EutN/CcmL family microcompartment protein [Virgibacillus byunsanensis]|uniref:EutN/CcmL family microcompartment protein n=1 Tax=Virgibacillus byunsanensis TaxID=570945 RepID=A0ABW3LP13_9BACI
MKLARVIGNVVSSVKTESHSHTKLMVVHPIDENNQLIGSSLIAADNSQAGIGDRVLIIEEGGSARQVLKNSTAAVDAVIAGIIDEVRD